MQENDEYMLLDATARLILENCKPASKSAELTTAGSFIHRYQNNSAWIIAFILPQAVFSQPTIVSIFGQCGKCKLNPNGEDQVWQGSQTWQ
jgi:hypothetical protein